jgi:hypothetical protein
LRRWVTRPPAGSGSLSAKGRSRQGRSLSQTAGKTCQTAAIPGGQPIR